MGMSDDPTDLELWQRAAAHDGAAFGQLFERHSRAVYNHCFRRTASWSSAEDLTSIVWAEAWRRRKDVRLHGESILPWLLAVANTCLRNLHASQRRSPDLPECAASYPRLLSQPAPRHDQRLRGRDHFTLGRPTPNGRGVVGFDGSTHRRSGGHCSLRLGRIELRRGGHGPGRADRYGAISSIASARSPSYNTLYLAQPRHLVRRTANPHHPYS